MKSYIQGMITGGVLVFAMVVLMGARPIKQYSDAGRYKFENLGGKMFMFDTVRGEVFLQPDINKFDGKGIYRWDLSIAK